LFSIRSYEIKSIYNLFDVLDWDKKRRRKEIPRANY